MLTNVKAGSLSFLHFLTSWQGQIFERVIAKLYMYKYLSYAGPLPKKLRNFLDSAEDGAILFSLGFIFDPR